MAQIERIKGFLTARTFREVYQLLDTPPLPTDCGRLCHKGCCQHEGGSEMGIYLLPGEDQLFSGEEDWLIWNEQDAEEYNFPPSWQGLVPFVQCTRDCPRDKRPIQCRTYPLAPHLTRNGPLVIVWETLPLPYTCPVIEKGLPLQEAFIHGVYRAWNALTADPLIRDLVAWDSREREAMGWGLHPVFPTTEPPDPPAPAPVCHKQGRS